MTYGNTLFLKVADKGINNEDYDHNSSETIEKAIQHILSEPDSGNHDVMNKKLKYVSSDVVVLLNSDDWYAPDVWI